MSYIMNELPDRKEKRARRLLTSIAFVLGIAKESLLTPVRWVAWRLWGRRQAVARLRELSGLVPKTYGPNAIEPPKRGSRSLVGAGPPLRPEDAHLEYYDNRPTSLKSLPKPDTDDSGLN